jgi:GMP synthase-like glutamine amidotransferase
MKVIILQHINIEDPGYIKDLMIKDGVELTTIELDEGQKIPSDLSKFDAMFCMGGPMDTWMEKDYPWLIEEKKAINEFVVFLKKPYLGFCLGCHSYEVQELEKKKDITLIASSPETKYQIFRYKNHAYGIQFHIEIKKTTVGEWGCVPEYKSALEKQLGEGALDKFDKDSQIHMPSMNEYSKILYENFKKLVQ